MSEPIYDYSPLAFIAKELRKVIRSPSNENWSVFQALLQGVSAEVNKLS